MKLATQFKEEGYGKNSYVKKQNKKNTQKTEHYFTLQDKKIDGLLLILTTYLG